MYPIGAKLELDFFFYKHIGTYLGNNRVLHNHSGRGEECVDLDTFSGGKRIYVKSDGVTDINLFWSRVQNVIVNPKSYKIFSNNCEHTASRISDGVASSPQLTGYVLLCVGALVLSRTMKA